MAKFDGTCLHCKHFDFSWGERGYSEYTPGSPASMECYKRHFSYGDDDYETLRQIFYQHLGCKDFEEDDRP